MEVRNTGAVAALAQQVGSRLDEALSEWAAVVGAEFVVCDPHVRQEAETATFATTQTVPAIVRPADRDELQQCMRIANQFRIPVYPVSSGKTYLIIRIIRRLQRQ